MKLNVVSEKNFGKMIPVAILLVGLFLRAISLQGESFWEDEAQSFYQARNPFFIGADNPFGLHDLVDRFVLLRYIVNNDIHPPFYYAQLGLWSLLGISDWFLRSNSILWGVLAIAAVYAFACKLSPSHLVAIIAASLVAFSPFHVEMSIELRMYSLISCLAVVSISCLHTILHQSRAGKRSWILFTVVNLLIVYSQGIGFLWLLLINLIYLGFLAEYWLQNRQVPPNLRSWVISQLLTVVAFSLWLAIKLKGGVSGVASVARYLKVPTPLELLGVPGKMLFNNTASSNFPAPPLTTPGWILTLLAVLSVTLIAVAIFSLRKNIRTLLLLTVPSLGGLLIIYLISVLGRPVFILRGIIFCLPFFALLVAIGLVYVSQRIPRLLPDRMNYATKIGIANGWLEIVLIAMIAVNAWGIYQGTVSDARKQWQEVGALVAQQIQPQDVILIPRSTMSSLMLYSPPINRQEYNGLLINQLRSYWLRDDFIQKTSAESGYQQFLQSKGLDYGQNVSWIIITPAVDADVLLANRRLEPRIWAITSPNKGGARMDQAIALLNQRKTRQAHYEFHQIAVTLYQ